MEVEKLRNLTDAELVHQQRELNDQLFRMKFQLKMGQTESLNKIRGLRKDVARIKTVMREKELGLTIETKKAEPTPAAETTGTAKSAKPARVKKSAAARKTAAAKKTTAAAKAKKKSTGAKAKAKARKK